MNIEQSPIVNDMFHEIYWAVGDFKEVPFVCGKKTIRLRQFWLNYWKETNEVKKKKSAINRLLATRRLDVLAGWFRTDFDEGIKEIEECKEQNPDEKYFLDLFLKFLQNVKDLTILNYYPASVDRLIHFFEQLSTKMSNVSQRFGRIVFALKYYKERIDEIVMSATLGCARTYVIGDTLRQNLPNGLPVDYLCSRLDFLRLHNVIINNMNSRYIHVKHATFLKN